MADTGTGRLKLRLFGSFGGQLSGAPLPRLRTRKGQWLLALLALRSGEQLQRGWLAGLLWPDSPEAGALANLRSVLKDLRHVLGSEAVRLHSPTTRTLSLDLAGVDLDVREFDAAIRAGDPPSLQRALALYRGPLLEDCHEEWVFSERQSREQAYLEALEALALLALEGKHAAIAERYLRRAIAVDPLRESAHRNLMQALATSGNYAAALSVYRELRQRLHREINIAPDAETQALYQQLRAEGQQRAQSASSAPAGALDRLFQPVGADLPSDLPPLRSLETLRHNLPLQLTSFVGRGREMQEVKRLLSQGRLLTLTGPGGCGKTRLSLQIAAELVEEYSDGVWFVELAPLSDERLVPPAVASVLGMREEPGRPVLQALTEGLTSRQLLLILDNCEHLITACAALVDALLRRCPRLQILASSREALAIAGETAYRVPSLPLPNPDRLPAAGEGLVPALTRYEAIQLFIDRATSARPEFTVTNDNAPAVAEVCHRLDGIPLAIELAAARVKALPVEQLAARLDDRFRLLTHGSRIALRRHQTLRALIDWSYDLLSAPEQILLCRLSAFAGGWTVEAAEAVCTGGAIEAWALLDLLTALVEKSLVVYEEREPGTRGAGGARYRLLETIRQYAHERLQEIGETEAVRSRHLEYFATLAEQAEPELWGPDLVPWLDRLEADLDNMRAALEWGGGQPEPPELWLRLVAALGEFWDMRDHQWEGLEWTHRARAWDRSPPRLRARMLTALGFVFNNPEPADEGVQIYRALNDPRGLSYALFLRAMVRDDKKRCRAWLEEGLAISREIGADYVAAFSLCALGHNELWVSGDGSAARGLAALEESVQMARRTGNPSALGWTTRDLGHALFEYADPERAESFLLESHQCFQAMRYRKGIKWSLEALGTACFHSGDMAAARAAYEETLAVNRHMKDRHGEVIALINAGQAARGQGDLPAARAYFTEARQLCEELGDQPRRIAALYHLGETARRARAHEEAQQLLEQSLTLAREGNDRAGVLCSLQKLAQLALDQQDWARACTHWVELIALAREWSAPEANTQEWRLSEQLGLPITRGGLLDAQSRAWGRQKPLLDAVEGLSRMWQQRGEPVRATRLLGAAQAAQAALRPGLSDYQPPDYAPPADLLHILQGSLDPATFEAAWVEGRALSLERAILSALEEGAGN